MAQPIAVPTKNAGEVFIPALGRTFQQVELREDDVFDTVNVITGLQTDKKYEFFRDIESKELQHTNLGKSRTMVAGDELTIFRVGLHPREARGNDLSVLADIKKLVGAAAFTFKVNKRIVTQGPVVKYPTGLGISGMSNETAAANGAQSIASIGLPSAAAAPTLVVPQVVTENDNLYGTLEFPAADWVAKTAANAAYTGPTTAADMMVSCLLHGLIKSPLGK